jgi:hypothetical protein
MNTVQCGAKAGELTTVPVDDKTEHRASITADRRAMPGHGIDTVNTDSKCRVQKQVAPARSTAMPSVQML